MARNKRRSSKKENYKRVRCKYVNFRITPEDSDLLDKLVELSGLKKQDYLAARVLNKEVIVTGNPRVFKNLEEIMNAILKELKRIDSSSEMRKEFIELLAQTELLYEKLNEKGE